GRQSCRNAETKEIRKTEPSSEVSACTQSPAENAPQTRPRSLRRELPCCPTLPPRLRSPRTPAAQAARPPQTQRAIRQASAGGFRPRPPACAFPDGFPSAKSAAGPSAPEPCEAARGNPRSQEPKASTRPPLRPKPPGQPQPKDRSSRTWRQLPKSLGRAEGADRAGRPGSRAGESAATAAEARYPPSGRAIG